MDDRAQAASDPIPVVPIVFGIVGLQVASVVLSPAQLTAVANTAATGAGWIAASATGGLVTRYAVRSDFRERMALKGP